MGQHYEFDISGSQLRNQCSFVARLFTLAWTPEDTDSLDGLMELLEAIRDQALQQGVDCAPENNNELLDWADTNRLSVDDLSGVVEDACEAIADQARRTGREAQLDLLVKAWGFKKALRIIQELQP